MDPEELIEEVLRRLPPSDPASLFRAALVSKRWSRLISGHVFRRRFREFHRSPPLLGLLCNRDRIKASFRFAPTSTFRPRDVHRGGLRLRAIHSGHGRVLLQLRLDWGEEDLLFIWNPVTGELRELPWGPPNQYLCSQNWNAAVLCAATGGGGCDHLDCHGGPFLIVFVATQYIKTFACVYSSETNTWSEHNYAQKCYAPFELGNSVLLGSVLYFKMHMSTGVLKYDLLTQEMSRIRLPADKGTKENAMLMATEEGRLGFATMHDSKNRVYLWSSTEHGPDDEGARWTQNKVIELDLLLPIYAFSTRPMVAGFSRNGAGSVIFIRTSSAGFFSIDIKSGRSRKVGENHGFSHPVVPFVSFLTPALKGASVAVGPSAGASSA